MREVFQQSKPKPTDAHRLLPSIPFSSVLTTNYDRLLEKVYEDSYKDASFHSFTHRDYPELAMAIRRGEFYLLKLHGTIDRIETIVLGSSDYREAMYRNPAYRQFLKTLFSTKTILFLGFGLTDPDFNFLLEELKTTFNDYIGPHYALMNSIEATPLKWQRFEKDYHIKILPYTPSGPHHPKVIEFLAKLTEQVKKIKKKAAPGAAIQVSAPGKLAEEVKAWLQALGYEVSLPTRLDDRIMEMSAVLEKGTVSQRVLIRCIGDEIKLADVEALDEVLTRKVPQGWLITDTRIANSAKQKAAADDEAYRLFTLSQFLGQVVWKNYFDSLKQLVIDNKIPGRYVDPACFRQVVDEQGKETGQEKHDSLDMYMDEWLKERGKVHFSLLGEFGTGKTWFCRHYAFRQLERCVADPVNQRLPLLITLRDFTKALAAEQLINDALLVRYKLPLMGNPYHVFKEMNQQGKILLILDGFDEMARKVDYQTVVDNFWELAKLVDDNSKVILTSRTEYFRWAMEPKKILSGQEKGRETIRLSPPRFEVFNLQPFDNDQIRQVIINCLGEKKGGTAADRILKDDNLAEMARKPVLIESLLAAMEEVDPGILENQSQVYLYATNKLLLRNIDTKRTFSTTADKLYFLCELALEMISTQVMQIHYKEIPARITGYFGKKIKDEHELDHWDFDLRSQTLLHRNAAGYYEFAHKSLAEYFVAFKFAAELGCLASPFKNTYKEEDGQTCAVPYGELGVEALAKTFGAFPMNDARLKAVKQIFIGMLEKDSPDRLWQLLRETKGKNLDQVQYVGGNLFNILHGEFDASFKGAELPRVVLFGSAFLGTVFGADLTGTNMKGAILHGVNFGDSAFANTDLRDADLKDIHLSPPTISSLLYSVHRDILIAGLADGSVRGWNTQTWEETVLFKGLSWQVRSIIATPGRHRIIFGDRKNTAILLDLDTGKELQRFENEHSQGHRMAITPDGNILACVDESNAIILFDIHSGNRLNTFHGTDLFFCAAFNEDGSKLIGGDEKGNLTIWGVDDGGELNKWNSKLKTIYNICHSKNRPRFFACGSTIGEDIFHCWDSETGEALFPFKSEYSKAAAFDNKETRFAVGDIIHDINIIDAESGMPIHTIKSVEGTNAIAFSPDDRFLASGNRMGTLRIWDVNESSPGFGKCVKIIDVKSNCNGMKISGARGLEQKMEWLVKGKPYEGTVLEYFIECGAIPDEKQKKQLAELKKRRKI
jgi:WD40 repeat protein